MNRPKNAEHPHSLKTNPLKNSQKLNFGRTDSLRLQQKHHLTAKQRAALAKVTTMAGNKRLLLIVQLTLIKNQVW